MSNAKQVLCLIMLVLLFANLESRSLEAFMERKNTPAKGCSRELIQKSQFLKAGFAKAVRFTNPTVSKRLSPGGPDPKHH
ncbi:CLAVATA3/ESR (CLE)-related protein 4 [Spatholobus suberectus]|nr:CLAVATA3/ESR (CLE)-related protein 4 [Spatholobus suberectus]